MESVLPVGLYSQPSIVSRMMDQNHQDVDAKDAAVLLPKLLLHSESLDLGQMAGWAATATTHASSPHAAHHPDAASNHQAWQGRSPTPAAPTTQQVTLCSAVADCLPRRAGGRRDPSPTAPSSNHSSSSSHVNKPATGYSRFRPTDQQAFDNPAAAAAGGNSSYSSSGGGAGYTKGHLHLHPFCSLAAAAAAVGPSSGTLPEGLGSDLPAHHPHSPRPTAASVAGGSLLAGPASVLTTPGGEADGVGGTAAAVGGGGDPCNSSLLSSSMQDTSSSVAASDAVAAALMEAEEEEEAVAVAALQPSKDAPGVELNPPLLLSLKGEPVRPPASPRCSPPPTPTKLLATRQSKLQPTARAFVPGGFGDSATPGTPPSEGPHGCAAGVADASGRDAPGGARVERSSSTTTSLSSSTGRSGGSGWSSCGSHCKDTNISSSSTSSSAMWGTCAVEVPPSLVTDVTPHTPLAAPGWQQQQVPATPTSATSRSSRSMGVGAELGGMWDEVGSNKQSRRRSKGGSKPPPSSSSGGTPAASFTGDSPCATPAAAAAAVPVAVQLPGKVPAAATWRRSYSPDAASSPEEAMAKLHVLAARKEVPQVDKATVKALVNAQLKASQPVRPPWYRDGSCSSNSGTAAGTPGVASSSSMKGGREVRKGAAASTATASSKGVKGGGAAAGKSSSSSRNCKAAAAAAAAAATVVAVVPRPPASAAAGHGLRGNASSSTQGAGSSSPGGASHNSNSKQQGKMGLKSCQSSSAGSKTTKRPMPTGRGNSSAAEAETRAPWGDAAEPLVGMPQPSKAGTGVYLPPTLRLG